ncbi:MAG: RNA polymerase sigma-70 factor [Ginsengibacter sp.]
MNTRTLNERDLVVLLNGGNDKAFEKLYNLYSVRLLGYLIRLVKSETFACELLHDVFVKIWNCRKGIDPDQSFRPYLFRVAENLVCDFFRKAAREKRLHTELINSASGNYLHIEENFSSKESAQLLREVIDHLPPRRRQVLQLIKIEERTYEEVSQLLNISPSTISDHIVKATKFIRQQLQGYHVMTISILTFLVTQ